MGVTDQLVNLKHAARICGISRTLFYRLLNQGRGPEPVEIDGARFFDRAALAQWNQRRRAERRKGGRNGTQRQVD